jgi:hypothetical protein
MGDVIATRETATLTSFVAFEADAPMRLIVRAKRPAVADLLAILTSQAEGVLTGVAESIMGGGAGPFPFASLGEEFDHDAEARFVCQLERRVAALSRLGPWSDDQQKTEKDCCEKLTQCSLPLVIHPHQSFRY